MSVCAAGRNRRKAAVRDRLGHKGSVVKPGKGKIDKFDLIGAKVSKTARKSGAKG